MKKKIIYLVTASFFLGGVFYVSDIENENVVFTDLTQSNIEALAQSEGGGTVTLPCVKKKDASCTYTVKLVSGETQERTEHDLDEAKNK